MAAGLGHAAAPAHLRDPEAAGAGRQPADHGAHPRAARRRRARRGGRQPALVPGDDPRPLRRRLRARDRAHLQLRGAAARHRRRGSQRARVLRLRAVRGHGRPTRSPTSTCRRCARTHDAHDWIATLAVKRVTDTSEYGVVVTGSDGRVQGFQEKPDPAEALSDLANCMIYVLEPEIFDHFPDEEEVDFALDVFPALLDARRPVRRPRHRRLLERRRLAARVPAGQLRRAHRARSTSSPPASWSTRRADGRARRRVELDGPVLLGDGAESATARGSTARW